jgi:hypothetical protein
MESLLDIKRRPVEEVVGPLKSRSARESADHGQMLLREAHRHALSLRDYLTLAIDPRQGEHRDLYAELSGYEAALAYLNLPVRQDFKNGVLLEAASETFQTYPGTRAMFPPVIDDMLYWSFRQDQIEQVEPLLAGSRTISGNEMEMTIVEDDSKELDTLTIPELARIPVRSLRTTETRVRMYKHGSGIRTSYEFNRRARLDILAPFAARVARELVRSKLRAAVAVLLGGDGVPGSAAPVVAQSSYNAAVGSSSTNGQISFMHLLRWLVERAQAGTPVDTVVGNFDAMFQWGKLFLPTLQGDYSPAEASQRLTGTTFTMPLPFAQTIRFVPASSMPPNLLLGLTRAETLEELRESGADIAEEERSILNQSITYVRTETTGYRMLYRDTRSVFNFGA